MSVSKFLALLVVSLCIASNAFAAGKSRELSLGASYVTVSGQGSASLFDVSIGQFVNPRAVVVTELMTQQSFGYTATTISVGGKYYFMDGFRGDLVPFAGGGIGLRQSPVGADSNHASTQYEVNGGLAYFLVDNTTIDGRIRIFNYNDSSPAISWFTLGFSQRF